jgi:hypothetical protein
MAAAAIRGASAVVTLDGDGQHDPADIDRLLAAAAAAPRALIVGSRLAQPSGLVRGRLNAIRVAGFFMNWVTGHRVEDTQSGFRLYPLDVVRELPTRRGGFVFETEVLVAAARRGVGVREVPVSTVSRAARRSRFRPIVDGVLIGAYLAERTVARWGIETRDAVVAAAAVLSRQRRAARHGALLLEASVYRHAPALWAMAIGTGAGHRAAARLLWWWRHPRRRRATVAVAGVTLTPLLLAVVICQALLDAALGRLRGRPAPDLVTPIVTRWFSQARLAPLDGDGIGGSEANAPMGAPSARASEARPHPDGGRAPALR